METNKRIIVVGGVAAGMSFATRYKRLHPHHEVIVFDKGEYVSFANCGLPYAISDTIRARARLIVETKERLGARFAIDVFTETEVIEVKPKTKEVVVVNKGETTSFSYDELVLAPGAQPIKLNIPGLASEDTFVLRNIPDLDKIKNKITDENIKNAIVIGAGYVGLEVAENLKLKGLNVTIVEKSTNVLPPFDDEMANMIKNELVASDVNVFTNTEIVSVQNKVATLKTGEKIPYDLVVMSVGVFPDTGFLKGSGINLSPRGAILVDDQYKTSVDHIYAVGDAILVKHALTGDLVSIALANPANRQGRHLADHLGGLKVSDKGSLGTAILKLFNKTFGSTGLNEKQLKAMNLPYKRIYLSWFDHATYYPGATSIYLKVLFNPVIGLAYGAQAGGEKGVDKRIDVLSTLIKLKVPVNEWPELEFAYAPPFSLAKDIINLAGYFAENVMNGITDLAEWDEIPEKLTSGAVVVDVRSARERARKGFIKGSINLPLEMFRDMYDELPKDKEIILYCDSGARSYNAERILKSYGYNAKNLNGSLFFYRLANPEGVTFDEM